MAFQKVLKHKCGEITNRLVKRIEKLLEHERTNFSLFRNIPN